MKLGIGKDERGAQITRFANVNVPFLGELYSWTSPA